MTYEELKEKYPYLYETHMHTREGSACASASGEEMADCYKAAGYTGIIITDHNWYGNTRVDRSLPWEEWVDEFFKGYEGAKKRGDEIGLQVFPGWEAGYDGAEFLIYGVTPDELKAHPELKDATVEEQLNIVHSLGGMVIQAHPYREAWYITVIRLYPEYADGLEIINASHSNPPDGTRHKVVYDDRAVALRAETGLPGTAGSDQHHTQSIGGGVMFPTKLTSIEDYISRIKNGDDYILTNGRQFFSKTGELLVTWKD